MLLLPFQNHLCYDNSKYEQIEKQEVTALTLQKKIPIGIEMYKKIIDNNYYYVDKTLLIRDLLDQTGEVTLFTRPRRFGKTLSLSMLQTFFEKEIDATGNVVDNSRYFIGKKIMDAGEAYTKHLGQYPVIFLSLKSTKQPNFEMAYYQLQQAVIQEFRRHDYILNDASHTLNDIEKNNYRAIMDRTAPTAVYATALQFLSYCLAKYHDQKVILLLDEYDVPLENAYFNGFYNEMIAFIRSLFESALKTNENLEFAVITGCLRISRESIFTGLNNLKVISVLNKSYAEYFGFVQNEVDDLLSFYNLQNKHNEVKEWYDGYLFGKTEVYNPWSLLNYVCDMCFGDSDFPKAYWSNTSSNDIIRKLIEKADDETKNELENLIAGSTIEKPIHEDITYEDIYASQDNLWNFLFFTGYLKAVEQHFDSQTISLVMKIPNLEIRYIYNTNIMEWFTRRTTQLDLSGFYQAVLAGKPNLVEELLRVQLEESISCMDSAENFYHGFVLGLLKGLSGYKKLSNRESGEGRYDIVLKPYDERKPAVILEIKRCDVFSQLDRKCEEALQQIQEKHYDAELIAEEYMNILKYGICFCKKSCRVKLEK